MVNPTQWGVTGCRGTRTLRPPHNDGPEFALPAAAGGQTTGDHCAAVHLVAPYTTADRSDTGSGRACCARRVRRNCAVTRRSQEACPSPQGGSSPRASGDGSHVSCGSQTAAEGRPDVHVYILAEPRTAPDYFQRPLLRRSRFQQQVSAGVRLPPPFWRGKAWQCPALQGAGHERAHRQCSW
jgi:hypothetical protein